MLLSNFKEPVLKHCIKKGCLTYNEQPQRHSVHKGIGDFISVSSVSLW